MIKSLKTPPTTTTNIRLHWKLWSWCFYACVIETYTGYCLTDSKSQYYPEVTCHRPSRRYWAFQQLKMVTVVSVLSIRPVVNCEANQEHHAADRPLSQLSYIRENSSLMHCTQGVGGSARLLSCWFSYGGLLFRKQREGTADVRLCISKCRIRGWQRVFCQSAWKLCRATCLILLLKLL